MNLKNLHYLVTVADTLHFGRAAERCYVSQPTLSGQIKKLEDELGVTLLERTNRSVVVTPIGEEVIKHAKLALEQSDAIQQLARAQKDPLSGPLRLGAIPTISPYLMPWILSPVRRDFPQMRLVLHEEITETLIKRLSEHQIDIAIIATDEKHHEFDSIELFDEPFWLALPVKHALYAQDEISQADLSGLELLLLSDGHCLANQVAEVCGIQNKQHDGDSADLRASSLETLLQFVGAGFGSTLVPALATRGAWMTDSGIVARKLDDPMAYRRIRLVFRKTFPRKAAIEALANIIWSHLPNTVKSRQVKP